MQCLELESTKIVYLFYVFSIDKAGGRLLRHRLSLYELSQKP